MTAHRIRLRGPWAYVRVDEEGVSLGEGGTMRHPDDWPAVVEGRAGRMSLTRTFHAPTNLETSDELFLVLTEVHGRGDVRLNGRNLGCFHEEQSCWVYRLPRPLPRFNTLEIRVAYPQPTETQAQVGVSGVVALEIRAE